MSKAHRRKMSLTRKGMPKTMQWKERIRQSLLGVKHTSERIRKNSISHMGKKLPPGVGYQKGHVMSQKIRDKIGNSSRGEKSHLWKGGITPLAEQIRGLRESRNWRSDIFKRDNFTCQECSERGGKIVAHHKNAFYKLFKFFLRKYNQFSPIEDKETLVRLATTHKPFWNIGNGITLCKECHKKTESYLRKPKL